MDKLICAFAGGAALIWFGWPGVLMVGLLILAAGGR
jgi:hypothetical protein